MRKVKFKHWIKAVAIDPSKTLTTGNTLEGTNKMSDWMDGFFHQWGTESGDGETYCVGIVEDLNGATYTTNADGCIIFIEPLKW